MQGVYVTFTERKNINQSGTSPWRSVKIAFSYHIVQITGMDKSIWMWMHLCLIN